MNFIAGSLETLNVGIGDGTTETVVVGVAKNYKNSFVHGSECLTFEVSGPQRRGAWAVWTRINHTATRPRRHAVAGPLDRGWAAPRSG